jgi:hypothetical protein
MSDKSEFCAAKAPAVLEVRDKPYTPVETTVEDRFRDTPTETILRFVSYGTLLPEVRTSALAELARRGVQSPEA